MNRSIIIIILIILLTIFGCYQEQTSQDIEIYYEFNDQVSPVMVKLSVNEDIQIASWTINDSLNYTLIGNNEIELLFDEPGISNIKLNASGTNNEQYNGEIDIIVPERANQLIIDGIYFDEIDLNNFSDDSLDFSFVYYDGQNHFYHIRTFQRSEILNIDTLVFDKPIIIEIDYLEQNGINDSSWVSFDIQNHNVYERSIHFRSNFFVNTEYFIERIMFPDWVQLFYQSEDLFVLREWINCDN